jgi:hypothetical protein
MMKYCVEPGTDGKWYVFSQALKARRPRPCEEYPRSQAARLDTEEEARDLRDSLNAIARMTSPRRRRR